ncbi:MAG: pantoate--beta-alanine ligase [Pseudomonadota bacterium]
MRIVRTIEGLRAAVRQWREEDLTVAVVPTMGGLHAGHISLVGRARDRAERVITTLFVNPTQFGANEDLDKYPRTEESDARMLDEAGCHLLFAPSPGEVYPEGFATRVIVDGLTDRLCGAARPGHFDGVSQVVSKLLNMAQADVAIFGEKDWQQLAVVRRMACDLDIPTRIIGAPTVREEDGLAMSSRNRYLTPEERAIASILPKTMKQAIQRCLATDDLSEVQAEGAKALVDAGFQSVDYFEFRTADDLAAVQVFDPKVPTRLFVAAHLGKARLIDNNAVAR